MTLTKAQREILSDLPQHVQKSMRSKPTLRALSKMVALDLIEFDPFAGHAKITDAGLAALQETT